ncbi:MAG: PcfB family protein [Oscillospiraceae bacterium]|nr:PcfB family protein [Oscillospiraceae bacterium]
MSYSGDAAEQVVRMTLEGAEVAAKITGAGAKEIAVLLYAVLKDQKRTKGKIRLANMLRTGKELKVFAVKDKDLAKFCREAKKYGVLYCVLKDSDAKDGLTDIMVRAEDSSKVNRIFDRFALSTVDMASVRSEIERGRAKKGGEKEEPEVPAPERSKEDIFLDALMNNAPKEEQQTENPTLARAESSRQSAPSSKQSSAADTRESRISPTQRERKSVREELREIRAELEAKEKDSPSISPEHIAPGNNKQKKKKVR